MVLSPARTRRAAAVTLAVLVVAAAGCASDDATSAAGSTAGNVPTIVATTGIWADVTSMVACDGAAEVQPLLPAGVDPHGFEPSLQDREVLDRAALVVANGEGVEDVLDDTLADVADGGVPVFRVVEHVVATDPGEGAPVDDPHVWFDPLAVRAVLPDLGFAVVHAGADPETVGTCVATAHQDLTELDAELRSILDAVPADRRVLVTNHAALGRFAVRYGFSVLGTVLPASSTLSEASPAELDDLAAAAEAAGVAAVFTEQHESAGDAEALADRLGVPLVPLYTESLGEDEATTYPDLLRYDARAIAAALTGD